MLIINVSLGYQNLQLDMQSSYIYPSEFQRKINKIFNDIPNVYGIADDILVIGYNKDGADHNKAVYNVLSQCSYVNLKLNKDKCHFRCTSIPFFGEAVCRQGVQPDPQMVRALTEILAPKDKRELQSFLGIINYLGKFFPGTAEVCDPLQKLTSSRMM